MPSNELPLPPNEFSGDYQRQVAQENAARNKARQLSHFGRAWGITNAADLNHLSNAIDAVNPKFAVLKNDKAAQQRFLNGPGFNRWLRSEIHSEIRKRAGENLRKQLYIWGKGNGSNGSN